MDCDTAREAISARIDGEDPGLAALGLTAATLETHLTECAACREWQARAHTVTRRARLGGSFLEADLTPWILANAPARPGRRRLRLAQRGTLAALALIQLAICVPMLVFGRDHDAGMHAAHELGSFNLALAIAFAVGALRPRLSAGLAWPCAIAAAGLVTTAVVDLIGGQAIGADEAQHLIALAGAALLIWQSRLPDTGSAAPALATGNDRTGTEPASDRTADIAPQLTGRPHRPIGGDAARLTGPDIAAAAPATPAAGSATASGRIADDEAVA